MRASGEVAAGDARSDLLAGLSEEDWAHMNAAERSAWITRNTASAAERATLIASSIRDGFRAIADFITEQRRQDRLDEAEGNRVRLAQIERDAALREARIRQQLAEEETARLRRAQGTNQGGGGSSTRTGSSRRGRKRYRTGGG